MIRLHRALLAAAVAALPSAAGAQAWRTMDVSRQLRDSTPMRVHVQYGAGRLDLRAATTPVLYAMQLRYDEDASRPLHTYDAVGHELIIGLDTHHGVWHGSGKDEAEMHLALAPAVPLDLDLALGAAQATVDLGGLNVRGLRLDAGAADETVDFSRPNPGHIASIEMNVGAASFKARNIANANASGVRVKGGVGAVDLDFGGTWSGDMDGTVDVALGSVALRVPRDVGLRLDVQRFAASFDADSLVKRDGAYYSDNWDSARYHLRLNIKTTFGGITLDRFGSTGN